LGPAKVPRPLARNQARFARIKSMLYLTPTTREHGAIRFVAGSHTAAYQASLAMGGRVI
jgi:ectoine hydroxylase-related dioxygenase (phytanoyl-CoA dioxygenase family)